MPHYYVQNYGGIMWTTLVNGMCYGVDRCDIPNCDAPVIKQAVLWEDSDIE